MLEETGRRANDPIFAGMADTLRAWGGRAEVGSVGYRLVRTFRGELIDAVYGAYTAPLKASVELTERQASRLAPPEAEDVVWRLLSERPAHLVPSGFADWTATINAALDRVAALVREQAGGELAAFTWGEANRARIQHPLSAAGLPFVSALLDAPCVPQAGDVHVPRVAGPVLGASERFVVAPGHEQAGIFHMPGGQSGHPLTSYYLAGHEAWLNGEPTPFLPGPLVSRLRLLPSRER
jgi:penicillin amidase